MLIMLTVEAFSKISENIWFKIVYVNIEDSFSTSKNIQFLDCISSGISAVMFCISLK